MKNLLFILFLLPTWLIGQDSTYVSYTTRLYVEVKDTFEVAYREYKTNNIFRDGFTYSMEIKRDSIGIDSFTLIRHFWIDPEGDIRYSQMQERWYKGERKGKSEVFTHE